MKAYVYKTSTQFNGSNALQAFEVIRGQPGGVAEMPDPLGFQEDLEVCSITDLGGGRYSVSVDQAKYSARETAKAQALQEKQAQEAAYAYAGARAKDYVQEFSKAPQPSQIDAIGHVLDAILAWADQHEVTPELQAILNKREAVKARHPKPVA